MLTDSLARLGICVDITLNELATRLGEILFISNRGGTRKKRKETVTRSAYGIGTSVPLLIIKKLLGARLFFLQKERS